MWRPGVRWSNVKKCCGFINRNDTREGVSIHETAITGSNRQMSRPSVSDGETVEFDIVVDEKEREEASVAASGGSVCFCYRWLQMSLKGH